jgi:predicted transcriptional regulator
MRLLDTTDILISVEKRYVNRMLSGQKRVELRRRAIRVVPGTRVWIYSKVPHGNVEAVAIVENVVHASPTRIWRDYGHCTGITRSEFDRYFQGSKTACAIILRQIRRITPVLALGQIRSLLSSFHPPQFFKKLREGGPELKLFLSAQTITDKAISKCKESCPLCYRRGKRTMKSACLQYQCKSRKELH